MKVKSSLFLAALLFLLITSAIHAQPTYTIYYQAGDTIYGIAGLSGEATLIGSKIPETVSFSHSGRYAAYHDDQGVWISRTDQWSPEKVISTLPEAAFALMWTPDDTRLILRLAFWSKDTDPSKQPLAYNLLTKSAEPWIWSDCDQIAQEITSKDFALICHANKDMPPQPVNVISLTWGGAFREYAHEQYTLLRNELVDHFPPAFDWGVTESGQNLVYTLENPNFQINSEKYSALEIVSRWSDRSEFTIDGPQEPAIESWFAVSPDRSMIAYSVFCGKPTGSCLQIVDLRTGAIKWNYLQTPQVDQVYDIVWYPDNQKVVLLGTNADINSNYHDVIHIFDVEIGTSIKFDVDNTSGIIAISS